MGIFGHDQIDNNLQSKVLSTFEFITNDKFTVKEHRV